jgi:hypothetical protein
MLGYKGKQHSASRAIASGLFEKRFLGSMDGR